MSSDGKGTRKLRAPLCPKCMDAGYTIRTQAQQGKLRRGYEMRRVRCAYCRAGKEWPGVKVPNES